MEMRNFERHDWMQFAGAERTADGQEPKIASFENEKKETMTVLIQDANGLQVHIYDTFTFHDPDVWDLEMSNFLAAGILAKGLTEDDLTPENLPKLGFTKIL